MYTNFQHT